MAPTKRSAAFRAGYRAAMGDAADVVRELAEAADVIEPQSGTSRAAIRTDSTATEVLLRAEGVIRQRLSGRGGD